MKLPGSLARLAGSRLARMGIGLWLAGSNGLPSNGAEPDRYLPSHESIARHKVPEWFEDAKFGMFVDWGLFSVAGWAVPTAQGAMYPDWYLFRMYGNDSDPLSVRKYHAEKWGKDFSRDDFIPRFTAKAFDPVELVAIAKASGAKYFVPFCKHHDGFCLWPSSQTDRNAAKMGPKRDLIGPLVGACRAAGLKFGFYQSLNEWEYPLRDDSGGLKIRLWDTRDASKKVTRIEPYDEQALRGRIAGKHPVRDYARDYLIPQTLEFIDRYDPDLIWFDGEWTDKSEIAHTYEIIAHYYNHAEGRREVAVNDRLGKTKGYGKIFREGDFYISEYSNIGDKSFDFSKGLPHKWEECRGISQSFGYNRADTEANVISSTELVRMLARIVACNGNLLLIVNLDGEGALPEIERTRLAEVGRWLALNGEAIYATRPWRKANDGDRVWFTRSKDSRTLYAICFDWPEGGITLHGINAAVGSAVKMLGVSQALRWNQRSGDVSIEVPPELGRAKPCADAYVLRLELPPS